MGEIFLQAGVPVAVCVQSNETIDDEACKLFSKEFYKKLVEGGTIKNAFTFSRDLISVKDTTKFKPCCCAHSHSKDCWWYKIYLEDPQFAHEIHSGNCFCDSETKEKTEDDVNFPNTTHQNICRIYNDF